MDLPAVLQKHAVTDADVIGTLAVSAEALRLWKRGERRISIRNAQALHARFGIPLRELRPDVFGEAAHPGEAA